MEKDIEKTKEVKAEKEETIKPVKKSNKGIIVLLIIIIIGLVGYICYDKGVFDGLLGNKSVTPEPKQEEVSKEEKLSEEEVMKLHDSLITDSGAFGFYFERKVSIEEIPANIILEYAFANYLDENNKKYSIDKYESISVCGESSDEYYFCNAYDESDNPKKISNSYTKDLTIDKKIIDEYIKKKFNTNRDFNIIESFAIQTENNSFDVYYNIDKKEYYLMIPHRGGDFVNMNSKYIKHEEKDNEIIIFDKPIVCFAGESGSACQKNLLVDEYSDEIWNKTYLINQTNNGTVYKGDNKISDGGKYFGGYNEKTHKYSYNFDLIYKDFDSELNTYKHTFKKADNGNYYWYSSEIVNK